MSLRQRIIDEFQVLKNDPQMILRVIGAMQKKAQKCIDRQGGHVEGHNR